MISPEWARVSKFGHDSAIVSDRRRLKLTGKDENWNKQYNHEMLFTKSIPPTLAIFAAASFSLAALDFRDAVIVVPTDATAREKKAALMVAEEVAKRTQIRLPIQTNGGGRATITIGRAGRLKGTLAGTTAGAEGFTLASSAEGSGTAAAVVTGKDDRGMIFGAGYLLRQFRMERQKLELAGGLRVTTTPATAVRGHQLGFRPKTNSYDAWDVAMWEQYIRELAIYGTNTIELLPPRSDDAPDSPHFPLKQIDMMVEMSRIADEYAIDVSVFYPALDHDYFDAKTVDFALKEWGEVFRRLPRIDAVFVPGGDPGDTPPKAMMPLLEKQTANLHKYHPKATMWMSPQGFSQKWMDDLEAILQTEPKWLTGIVFGPQVMYSLPELRARVPKRYPIRLYPDITHMMHAQYPTAEWDSVFPMTEGREIVNPRPLAQRAIFLSTRTQGNGFVAYSEGCHDDVNKMLWSALGWNPDADVRSILEDYSRFFLGPEVAVGFAEGLLALERNWTGALATNTGIDTTLQQFQAMERTATPARRANWRFLQPLYRAYYDAYLRGRLRTELDVEERAMDALRRAPQTGADTAVLRAETALYAASSTERTRELRQRVFELAEGLYQSIRMQLSVTRYQATAIGRGANLDAIDFSLNNREWLRARFAAIRATAKEAEKLAKIDEILQWTNPGPGGFYDDLGNPNQQPHLVRGTATYDADPDYRKSPLVGFSNRVPEISGARRSWYDHAEALYEGSLQMEYTGLDPAAQYKVRVVYGGDAIRIPIRLMANGDTEIHPMREKPQPVAPLEFPIPRAATANGKLRLAWTRPPGLGGNGRGAQVSEVWLIRVP